MHWMIAEDEADIRHLVAAMCQMWGHTPLTFRSGTLAWEWLDAVESGEYDGPLPEFALMDIRMPGPRGNEIAQRIRTIPCLRDLPIVLMTAFVLSEVERKDMVFSYGVDLIINKPLPGPMDLHAILHKVIDDKLSG